MVSWQVDQAILSEEDRVVVLRFGHDWDPTCMRMDETLYTVAERVKNFAVVYLVDITEVPDFNKDKQELIDIIETVFRGARKGRGLVVSPKDYSTKYKY
ncbi:mitosis protein DIM1-domain-containing protein [Syncephalis fuscata]|nr:mitosis protein DIM1-domain-containing protein [Syncephalis fuscata]